MELETAFHIIAIVFMSLMIILIIALLTAVLVIKKKINNVHDMVDERVSQVKSVVNKFSVGMHALKYFVKK